jgi:hypothetical protein
MTPALPLKPAFCGNPAGHKEVPMNKKYIVRLSDEELDQYGK